MSTATTALPDAPSRRLPPTVYLLALGVFCLGTSEFMLAGLLPEIATDLHTDLPRAGLLITAFAVGMMVGAPVMAVATLRLPPKTTLLAAGAVFGAAHLLPLIGHSFALVLLSRVIAAIACAAFWAVGAVLAARIAGAGRTARALAVMVGGLTLSNILGVPAGTLIGQHFGWRGAFVAVAAATAVCLLLIAIGVPAVPVSGIGNLRQRIGAELVALRQGRLWLALLTTAAFQAAVFCAFSYLAPLLTEVAGIGEKSVPTVLLLFGIGSFVGVTIGGRIADRNMLGNVFGSLLAMTGTLLLLLVLAGSGWWAAAAVFAFGAAGFSIAAALNGRVFAFAGTAPTLAAGINVSAFNLGNAVGPWLGGLVIGAGLGYRAPLWAAIGLGLLALGIATASSIVEQRPVAEPASVPVTAREPGARGVSAEACAPTGC
ncbi:Cmx/CmrA family chloramphenicol efflux MFS transporter [Nakamurella lactea]|uniref:Cmx/CmrA family chloramphenicol efflux MFS transporter n=1 Tax=Nakamurella lactea TaxID=459515 RepID=UPI00041C27E9|nr:Cmx/CmrA family chloramphenicol efflux MFS transporter [Nakamurella lactea]